MAFQAFQVLIQTAGIGGDPSCAIRSALCHLDPDVRVFETDMDVCEAEASDETEEDAQDSDDEEASLATGEYEVDDEPDEFDLDELDDLEAEEADEDDGL